MIPSPGDYVKLTDGFIDHDGGVIPIPKSLIGAYGQLVSTGRRIAEVLEPGNAWGNYVTRTLPEPFEEIKVKIISDGRWKGCMLEVDGLSWKKLSPLEMLALQTDEDSIK